jgi:hypothetical protein
LALGYLQKLKDVEAHVKVGELGVEDLEVSVVDALEDQRGGLGLERRKRDIN